MVKKKKKKTPVKKSIRKKTATPGEKVTKAKTKTREKVVKSVKKVTKQKKTNTQKITKSSMREKKIVDIKKNLLSRRENLLREAEEALNILPGEINFPDMGDQATAESDRDVMLRLRDRERLLLKKIDEAVERIENNTFGICEECTNEIGIKRLAARPVTTFCIDCKTRQEEEERIAEGG